MNEDAASDATGTRGLDPVFAHNNTAILRPVDADSAIIAGVMVLADGTDAGENIGILADDVL